MIIGCDVHVVDTSDEEDKVLIGVKAEQWKNRSCLS